MAAEKRLKPFLVSARGIFGACQTYLGLQGSRMSPPEDGRDLRGLGNTPECGEQRAFSPRDAEDEGRAYVAHRHMIGLNRFAVGVQRQG
jgi:hypothetical protein